LTPCNATTPGTIATVNQEWKPVVYDVTIPNREGMHARPVMRFVDVAQRFASEIRVSRLNEENTEVDGKSPMELMLLGAIKGTQLRISAAGPDAENALAALSDLVKNRFDMDPIE
jgi:phosphotransferase system HPr (HPr) family protein